MLHIVLLRLATRLTPLRQTAVWGCTGLMTFNAFLPYMAWKRFKAMKMRYP